MPRWSQVHFIRQIQPLLRSKWARPTAVLVTLLLLLPVAAMAQGSPFDTGFNAIQSLFTGTIAKVASLVAIVIGGYLLLRQCDVDCPAEPDASNVAGIRTWNSLGRFVKRGEKGIFILAPMVGNKRTERRVREPRPKTHKEQSQRTLFRLPRRLCFRQIIS